MKTENWPAIGVDRERFILVFAPVLALTDEASKLWEAHVSRVYNHLLITLSLKQQPPATLVCREVTLRIDGRHQVGLVTYGTDVVWSRVVYSSRFDVQLVSRGQINK